MPTPILAHGGEAALLILAVFAAILLAELAAAAVALTAADLLIGGGLLFLLKRKRHLFWSLPLLNVACWWLVGKSCLWLPASSGKFAELNRWLIDLADWLMYPLALVVGLLTAGMLGSVQWGAKRALTRRQPGGAGDSPATAHPETGDIREGDPLPRPAAAGAWPAFREGFLTPWDGLGFMWRHPRLWKYGVVPVVLNVIITGAVMLALVVAVGFAIDRLHPLFPAGWGWLALEILSGAALLALALLAALISWLLLQSVLCGYFYGRLAEQVELELGMNRDEMKSVSLAHQAADALRDVTALVVINAGLLVLNVVPVAGSIAAFCGSTYFNLLILGGDFVAYPLDLRGMRRADKRAYVRRFRFHTLGLGAVAALMLLIPVLGAVLLTTAVTGSVLLHRRQQAPIP